MLVRIGGPYMGTVPVWFLLGVLLALRLDNRCQPPIVDELWGRAGGGGFCQVFQKKTAFLKGC